MIHPPATFQRVPLALLLAALLHGAAYAEEVRLPEVPVTASAIQDINASAVESETMQSLRPATSDTASLLRNVPGVTIQGSGGVSGLPVIHGLADDRLRIKVDGMDLISACGNHMNPPLSYIDPSQVGSAKVFAGISPVSVGGDSIGGTILVDSAAPQFAQPGEGSLFTGEAGFFYRSNGNAFGDNLSVTAASEKVSLSYRSASTEAENYHAGGDFKDAGLAAAGRGWLDADEVGSSMYKSVNRSLGLAVRSENHLTELRLGMQDIPYQGWTNQRMDMTGNDSTQANLRYLGDYQWGGLEARVYQENTRHYMQFHDDKLFWYGANNGSIPDGESCTIAPGMNGCAAGMPMDTEAKNSGAVLKAELGLSDRDLIRIGSEMQQYRLNDWWDPAGKGMYPDVFVNINDGERDRTALFAEWEAQWNARWLTQLGVRGERVEMNAGEVQGYNASYNTDATAFNNAERAKTDDNLDWTALARITASESSTIELGMARKTRSPNLYERYTWSTGGMAMRMINWAGDGNGYVGNLELEPEVAHTVSASFSWQDGAQQKWAVKLMPYYTDVEDYIDVERLPGSIGVSEEYVYLRFVNQSAHLYGADLSGHYRLADSLLLNGMLAYTQGKNDTTGDNLYNIMPLNARLALVQNKASWSNTAEIEWVDAKEDVSAVRNEMQTESYSLLHLRSSYTWKQARFDIGVENVFDKFYNHPLGGTYMGQGKTMSGTGVAWGTPVPGMGRSLYAGVNIKF